nr:STM4015 family protein [Actinomadura atramentaria]
MTHGIGFAGLPVIQFVPTSADEPGRAADPLPAAGHALRVSTEFDGPAFADVFTEFTEAVETAEVAALVLGYWGASYDNDAADPVKLLVEAADRFPNLRSLFIGDIEGEEQEISWIEHGDLTPLFAAYPELTRLEVRGASGLRLDPVAHNALRELRMESGGLPGAVVRGLAASDLPALEHLDLWLGTGNYGGDATVADLAPILGGERFPALRHLGLEDSEIADEIAAAVAGAGVVARLESLSLALGALTDDGAEALLAGQPLTHLKKLDLHHHYLSEEMMARVRAALPGVEVDLDEREEPYVFDDGEVARFIAVSE